MKKADYATLASIICAELAAHRDNAQRVDSLLRIARQFAGRASVDKAEFLKACGLD